MRKLFYSILIGIAALFAFTGCKPSVASIDVTPPTQVNYYVGDTLTLQGASILVTFSNNSTETIAINATGVSVSTVDMTTPGSKTVTVTYKTKSDTFTINVTAVALQSIDAVFTPGSTVIYTSTPLNDLKGYLVVTGTNNNGSSAGTIAPANYSLSGTLTAGTRTITVSYNTLTDTFQVTVVAVVVESYHIKTPATKVAFDYLESFSSQGLVVESVYNDGARVDESSSNYTIDSSAYNASAEGTYTIAIKVAGSTVASYQVTVTATSAQLTTARNAKKAEITSYLESDYYATEWTQLSTIRTNALTAIDGLTTIAAIENYNTTTVNASLDAIKTKTEVDAEIAAALAAAKTAKIGELTVYTESNYYATQWTELQTLYTQAVSAINSKTLISEVQSFDVATVNSAMAAIQTKTQVDAAALAAAKTAKLADLDAIYGNYDEANYYATEWTIIQNIYNGTISTINAKTSVAEVNGVNLTVVSAAFADVKTKTQMDAEALATAKSDMISAVTLVYQTYDSNDYYATQWAEIQSIFMDAQDAINALTTVSAVNAFDVNAVSNAFAAIPTKTQIDADAFASAKTALLADVGALFELYNENDYYEDEWADITSLYGTTMNEITGYTLMAEVLAFDLEALEAALEAIPTQADVDAQALTTAINDKIDDLDAILAQFNQNDYYPDDWADIMTLYTATKNYIQSITNTFEVMGYDLVAVEDQMNDVPTRAELDSSELTDAKNAALAQLDTYLALYDEDDYYSLEWTLLMTIYQDYADDIISQTSVAGVNDIDLSIANDLMAAVFTKAEVDDANFTTDQLAMLNALNAAFGDYAPGDYYTAQWTQLQAIYTTTLDALNAATTLADLALIDVDLAIFEMASILNRWDYDDAFLTLQMSLHATLEDYITSLNSSDYYTSEWNEIIGIYIGAYSSITNASTLQILEAIDLNEAIDQMDAVLTKLEIQEQQMESQRSWILNQLQSAILGFEETDYRAAQWNELITIYNNAITEVTNFTYFMDIMTYDVYAKIAELEAIPTDEEMTLEELLQPAREAKLAQLVLPNEEDYYLGDWQRILEIQQNLADELATLTSLVAIDEFDISGYQESIDEVPTQTEMIEQIAFFLESEMGLNRPLTEAELAAIPIVLALMNEYEYMQELLLYGDGPTSTPFMMPPVQYIPFEQANQAQIELVIQRSLTQEERDAVVMFQRINVLLGISEMFNPAQFDYYQTLLRVQDWDYVYAAYQAFLLSADAYYDTYSGLAQLPDNIILLAHKLYEDFFKQLRFINEEAVNLYHELDRAFLIDPSQSPLDYYRIDDGSLALTHAEYVLSLEGIVGPTTTWFDTSEARYWVAIAFVLPEGFEYENNNISLFILQANSEEDLIWVYTPFEHEIVLIQGQPHLILYFDLLEVGNYYNMSEWRDCFDIRLVFGANLEDPDNNTYSSEDLPGIAKYTSTITIDYGGIDLLPGLVFVTSYDELVNALADENVNFIYIRYGDIELEDDILIEANQQLFVGYQASLINLAGSTLTLGEDATLHNFGRLYNYGTFSGTTTSMIYNYGFAFNFGNFSYTGGMGGEGFGSNYYELLQSNLDLILYILGEEYVISPEEEGLVTEVVMLRTRNLGYLPSFDSDWSTLSAQEKATFLQNNFIFELSESNITDLINYYDYFADMVAFALTEDPTRGSELEAYRVAWLLGSLSDEYIERLVLALARKQAYYLLGGENFETDPVYYIENYFYTEDPLTSEEVSAISFYQSIYRYLAQRDIVVPFLAEHGIGETILYADFNSLMEAAYKIHLVYLAMAQEPDYGMFPLELYRAESLIGDYFTDEEAQGYSFYISYYLNTLFAQYLQEVVVDLERPLTEEEQAALRMYFDWMIDYSLWNGTDFEDFQNVELYELENWVADNYNRYPTDLEKEQWFIAKQLEIIRQVKFILQEMPDQTTIDAIPVILQMMYEYGVKVAYVTTDYPESMQEATSQQIEYVLNRPLTSEEQAALVIFYQLQEEMMNRMFEIMVVPMFEEMFGVTFNPDDIELLRTFFYLNMEYEEMQGESDPGMFDFQATFLTIEGVLERPLTSEEKDSILFIRFYLLNSHFTQSYGTEYTQAHADVLPLVLILREEYAAAWDDESGFNPELLANPISSIEVVLARTLTTEEADAITLIQQLMSPK